MQLQVQNQMACETKQMLNKEKWLSNFEQKAIIVLRLLLKD